MISEITRLETPEKYAEDPDDTLLAEYVNAWFVIHQGWYTRDNATHWYMARDGRKAEILKRMKERTNALV